jgi:hypothetical protein
MSKFFCVVMGDEFFGEAVEGGVHAMVPSLDACMDVLFYLCGGCRAIYVVAAAAVDEPSFPGAQPSVDEAGERAVDGAPVFVHDGGEVFGSLFSLQEMPVYVQVELVEVEKQAEHVAALHAVGFHRSGYMPGHT